MKHKRSIPNRGFRVADQIQRDVAELIRDLKDPRIGMLTINSATSRWIWSATRKPRFGMDRLCRMVCALSRGPQTQTPPSFGGRGRKRNVEPAYKVRATSFNSKNSN